jgi:large subunit ribosomal protein L29
MRMQELRSKSIAELELLLQELAKEKFNLYMQKGSGQLAKPGRFRGIRREVARIKTALNERRRAGHG